MSRTQVVALIVAVAVVAVVVGVVKVVVLAAVWGVKLVAKEIVLAVAKLSVPKGVQKLVGMFNN